MICYSVGKFNLAHVCPFLDPMRSPASHASMLLRIVLGILPLFYQTEAAMEDLQLLTVDQVSRRLSVGPDAVRRWQPRCRRSAMMGHF